MHVITVPFILNIIHRSTKNGDTNGKLGAAQTASKNIRNSGKYCSHTVQIKGSYV